MANALCRCPCAPPFPVQVASQHDGQAHVSVAYAPQNPAHFRESARLRSRKVLGSGAPEQAAWTGGKRPVLDNPEDIEMTRSVCNTWMGNCGALAGRLHRISPGLPCHVSRSRRRQLLVLDIHRGWALSAPLRRSITLK